jgi:hypothetical protein
MLSAFFGSGGEVVQVCKDDMRQIMKDVCHGPLKSATSVLEAEGHDMIGESTLGGSECGFLLIGWVDLNFVVARENVHEGKSFVASTIINNLVDKGRWKIVFGTSMTEITKIRTNTDSALLFFNGDGVGDP